MQQISMFGDEEPKRKEASECCYTCEHFAEFKEPRRYTNRDGEFGLYGVCLCRFNKNGSYDSLNVYVPGGRCKQYKKRSKKQCDT